MSDSTVGSAIRLSRSRQTWTGAGSAAGFVLRYVAPMRWLLTEMTGSEASADRALAILIQHLVKAGYGEHDQGRLRDFLIRGMRSAAKAQALEKQEAESADAPADADRPETSEHESTGDLKLDVATLESPIWIRYWRESMLQRSWRALERYQHAHRFQSSRVQEDSSEEGEPSSGDAARHDLVYDVLKVAMAHSGESAKVLSGRVAAVVGRQVSETELRSQLADARSLFAQFLADEVAGSLQDSDPKAIREEIKTLGLAKAFSGLKVRA